MQTKLTLSIEEETIKQAKNYARKHNKSISQIVETYFRNLTENEKEFKQDSKQLITPITDSLAGSLKGIQIDDLKTERSDYLERKYLKS